MKKQISALALVLALALMVIPVSAETVTDTYGYLTYEISDGEVTITDCDSDASGSLTIPDTIGSYPVTGIGSSAFSYCASLTGVIIPNNVTSIGDYAFYYCTNLVAVTIPDSITSIGRCAFWYCTSLTGIEIPAGVTNIPDFAFSHCDSLSGIAIPDSVTGIGSYAFDSCKSLTSIEIPAGVNSIGECAFRSCDSLTDITVSGDNETYQSENGVLFDKTRTTLICYPGGKSGSYSIPGCVTGIGSYAFYGCANLTGVTIPDGLTDIGAYAFYACTGLSSVTIPDSVTGLGEYAFCGCTGLTGIRIPGSVSNIGQGAFIDCAGLTSVIIDVGVGSIDEYAFSRCTGLTSVTIPDSVTSIGSYAFDGCTGLTSITVSDSITYIGSSAFYNTGYYNDESNWDGCVLYLDCYLLRANAEALSETYEIKNGTTVIANGAFLSCDGLTDITIPNSVSSICLFAFNGCTSLTDVYYNGTEAEWAAVSVAYGNHTLLNASIHYNNVPAVENPFTDVNTTHYFYDSVLWAVENGVTSGTSETTFSPFQTAERCQVVTFLWRAAGCPEVAEGTENPFTDVDEDDYFYTAVLWAVEKGITSGTTETTFSPFAKCERCQVVTFLYRYFGQPEVTTTANPFTDVNTGNYFYNAVQWAVENGITSGTTETTFGPFVTCERCMVVTFLYRALVE